MSELQSKSESIKNPYILERPIDLMAEGDSFYVVPWAIWVDDEGKGNLHPKYRTHDKPLDFATMRITRTADGFDVDIPETIRHERPRYDNPKAIKWISDVNLIPEPAKD